MLDFRKLADDLDTYRAALGRRPTFDTSLLDRVKDLWADRASAIQKTQTLQAEKNRQNAEMKRIFKEGTDDEKKAARENQRALSDEIKGLEARVNEVEEELSQLMLDIPNVPHTSVPNGEGEADNQVVRHWGEKPTFDFAARDHVSIGQDCLGLFDFDRAGKLTGSRFSVQYDGLARLERAVAMFMLDTHTAEHGYREVAVPYLVNSAALTGTGQLPKFADDQFKVPYNDNVDYWLIPTAEVPVTNLYADSILMPDDGPLPHTYCCHTPCFRKEAGAAGRDTRGILRQHQFHKVELVRFVDPETSYDELEKLVGHAEAILQKLELHYRVSLLCTGDMSANAAKCYDLEVWLPGQDEYREISSCSNFEDFQARRAKIRYKTEPKGKARLLHTLNGSGLATGRTVVAILEQYQDADGGVRIPKVLLPYMGGVERLEPKAS